MRKYGDYVLKEAALGFASGPANGGPFPGIIGVARGCLRGCGGDELGHK